MCNLICNILCRSCFKYRYLKSSEPLTFTSITRIFKRKYSVENSDNETSSTNCKSRKTPKMIIKLVKKLNESENKINLMHKRRATDKFFFGPLLETKNVKIMKLQKEEYNSSKSQSKFNEKYENFASLYSGNTDQYQTSFAKQINRNISNLNPTKIRHDKGNLVSKYNHSYFIDIDNSKFPDVPQSIDINTIRSYPLFKSVNTGIESSSNISATVESSNNPSSSSKSEGIVSIEYRNALEKCLPSVGRILNDTMSEGSRAALLKWETKMIAKLGEQGFKDYKNELFSQGSLLHSCIKEQLQHGSDPEELQLQQMKGHWQSVASTVREMRGVDGENIVALESRVTHPYLHYAGILDCVGQYRDTPVLVEWKTSTKPKPSLQSTYDNPLQLAAYMGAMQYDPNYNAVKKVQSGLLVYSYSSGISGHTHLLSPALMQRYWSAWLQRLELFWQLNARAVVVS